MTGWVFVLILIGREPLYALSPFYETKAGCERFASVELHYDKNQSATMGNKAKFPNEQFCFYVGRRVDSE